MSKSKKVKNKKQNYNKKIKKELNENIMIFLQTHVDKLDENKHTKVISDNIYKRIKKALSESEKVHHDYVLSDIKAITHKENKFINKEVLHHIQRQLHYQYNIMFSYNNIEFYIKIVFDELPLQIKEYVRYMKWVICLCCSNIKNDKKEKIHFSIYLTNLIKEIDLSNFENIIESSHCNSGFSSFHNHLDVCIYRKEEWLKIFIHECFHIFNMDFSIEDANIKFSDTFCIQSEFLIYESFVEFWARVLNCAIFTYELKKNISQNDFYKLYRINLDLERIFSLYQANKLLNLFHITYNDVISIKKDNTYNKIYKENTNAFCYYVITSIMMNFFDKTIEWFNVHNEDLLYFDKNENQIELFCHYIKHLSKNQSLIKMFDEINRNYKMNTTKQSMKMILFEVQV